MKPISIEQLKDVCTHFDLCIEEGVALAVMAADAYHVRGTGYQYSFLAEMMNVRQFRMKQKHVNTLVDKGLAAENHRRDPDVPANIDEFEATEKAVRFFFDAPTHFGEELYEAYPDFAETGDGKRYPLKMFDRDMEELFDAYAGAIGNNRAKHRDVLSLLEWAEERDMIDMGLQKFVFSRYWQILRKEKETERDLSSDTL